MSGGILRNPGCNLPREGGGGGRRGGGGRVPTEGFSRKSLICVVRNSFFFFIQTRFDVTFPFCRKTGCCRSTTPDLPLTPAPSAPPTFTLAVKFHQQRLGLCDCVGPRVPTTFRPLFVRPGSCWSVRLSSPPEVIGIARCLQSPAETSHIL